MNCIMLVLGHGGSYVASAGPDSAASPGVVLAIVFEKTIQG